MSRYLVLGVLFLILFVAGCVTPPDTGSATPPGNTRDTTARSGLTAAQLQRLEELKSPLVVEQQSFSETELRNAFVETDELYSVLNFAETKGFDQFLGAVKANFSDGNTTTVVLLANTEGKLLFAERIETEQFSKSLLMQIQDETHYTIFDELEGIRRDGETFTRLGLEDLRSLSFSGSTPLSQSTGVLAPTIATFGFCDEKKGGFWDCLYEKKWELGFSVLGVIATCTTTVLGSGLTVLSGGALAPAEAYALLGCIATSGSTAVIIADCIGRLIDNSPTIDAYSQLGEDCFVCDAGQRWKMKRITMRATVEDDRLPDPSWISQQEVTNCGADTASYVFVAQDCGGNRASEEESAELPAAVLAQEQCVNNDSCCPIGCTTQNDSDCDRACGNGVKEEGEECDGTDFGDQTCESLGFAPGNLQCTTDCLLVTDACGNCRTDDECGDGFYCTQDRCIDFSCQYSVIENCCEDTSDCNDYDICTSKMCTANHTCQFTRSTPSSPIQPSWGSSCSECSQWNRECVQELLVPGLVGCCPDGYCLADSYCHPPCSMVNGQTCRDGSWSSN